MFNKLGCYFRLCQYPCKPYAIKQVYNIILFILIFYTISKHIA